MSCTGGIPTSCQIWHGCRVGAWGPPPPGLEGYPGGGTINKAVLVWQREAVLWHLVDPRTMAYLSEFCSDFDGNLVDICGLDSRV